MDKLAIINDRLTIVSDSEPLTAVDLFKLKNKLSEAEFDYLMILKRIGRKTLGDVRMPNGEIKQINK